MRRNPKPTGEPNPNLPPNARSAPQVVASSAQSVHKNRRRQPRNTLPGEKSGLAMLFAAMNLLAFAIHTVCDSLEDLWIKARDAKRARKRFFDHIRTITAYLVFPDWETLLTTLIDSKPPPEIEKQLAN
jgi:Na+-transporting methylmalonyl-CoA/oxaloacetate decarboxylase gamma subunit